MPHNISDNELAKLSDEEKAALSEEDAPSGEETDGHHSVGMGSDLDEGETPPEKPAKPAAPITGEEPVTENAFPEDEEPFAVPYKYDPAQFDLKAAEARIAELDKQFQDGDIDLNDYNRERDGIKEEVISHKVSAKISGEMTGQVAVAKWQATVDAFLDQKGNSIYKSDEIKYVALDHMVRKLASDPKNSNKSEGWLLREGDRLVRASMGMTAGEDGPIMDPKKKALEARRPAAPPPSLGSLPNAAPGADEDEFANLDGLLDGTAEGQARYERAISKMSKEEQDRYARS